MTDAATVSRVSVGIPSQTPWRVVVSDDEPLARLRLRSLLAAHSQFEIVAECADGNETLSVLQEIQADVLLLDVRMPQLDGLAVAEVISANAEAGGRVPAVVFVTAYDVHAVNAFDLDAIDYLVKPVDVDRFERMIARLEARLAKPGSVLDQAKLLDAAIARLSELQGVKYAERLAIRSLNGTTFVATADIDRIDADGSYVGLWVAGRRQLLRESMNRLVERLDPAKFMRVHRSAIVAIDRITRIEPSSHGEYVIVLADGSRVESSRTYGAQVQQLMRW